MRAIAFEFCGCRILIEFQFIKYGRKFIDAIYWKLIQSS